MGISPQHPGIVAAVERGLIVGFLPPPHAPRDLPLVRPAFAPLPPPFRGFVCEVPVRLESEPNTGGKRRAAIGRKAAVKAAVFKALAPHWAVWGPLADAHRAGVVLDITVTRMGGRGLDCVNSYGAAKPVEDAVATLMGADDGSPRWRLVARSEAGPAWGVRVEVSLSSVPQTHGL